MPLDLLAIAAHPDDVELSCGGTLIKMKKRGYRTGILDLTRGESGTRGSAAIRLREAQAAARVLGVDYRGNLRLPDARLDVNEANKLAVAEKIRELEPHTVILPYWEGRHPDHYHAARLAYEGCFLAGLKRLRGLRGQPFRPFKVLYATLYDANVRPTFVVDISAEYEQRRRAILCYASQFRPRTQKPSRVPLPLDQLESRMDLLARYFGQMIGVAYGEPFLVKEVLQVDDVVRLPVRSF
ncbi:MAG: bacillithiol biosynthesis deacetylase BshB1 [Acidobacteriia bacterium]|jgi:bacillithiol biosynthesis deacetylase BshB1|nr:bacillithiol biosynthesis deacetylase BshB1 [Terriglobia bacterium]